MEELQRLWQYQKIDMEVDAFEREMRQSPNRQKLIKHRDFLVEQQNAMRKIEADIVGMSERVESIGKEIAQLEESLRDLQDTLEETEPETLDIARKSLEHAQKLMHGIGRLEQELQKIRKDSDVRVRQQHEVRVRAAKVKAEFDKLKELYDAEYKLQSQQLEALKARAAKASEGITGETMEKYKKIKLHRTPPVAALNEDRCGGCNMNLPAVVLRNIRMGAKSVECENCGRIVLVEVAD
ncbi:MAG TPA: C4-type zinc ribbon domain-containing protein [Clostridia bacterium]|nr:C4-type zinc ribbon domain-containing protein [Clostridia bacterium]